MFEVPDTTAVFGIWEQTIGSCSGPKRFVDADLKCSKFKVPTCGIFRASVFRVITMLVVRFLVFGHLDL